MVVKSLFYTMIHGRKSIKKVRLDFFALMPDEQNWKRTDVCGTTEYRRTWKND
jgi:hypothetical protein